MNGSWKPGQEIDVLVKVKGEKTTSRTEVLRDLMNGSWTKGQKINVLVVKAQNHPTKERRKFWEIF